MGNYGMAWIVYICASVVFFLVFWRITAFKTQMFLSYCCRAMMIATVATPWYVSDQEAVIAPALMIVMMDAITIGSDAAVRAFVPLFLANLMALIGGVILYIFNGKRNFNKY